MPHCFDVAFTTLIKDFLGIREKKLFKLNKYIEVLIIIRKHSKSESMNYLMGKE